MVLDKLGSSLKSTLSKIKNSLTVDKNLVAEVVKEIQKALLGADVNVRLVLDLTQTIQKRATTEDNKALAKKEHLITIIYEELTRFLGDGEEFEIKEEQNRILLVGLYGQGKTTTSAKLGLYFKNRSKKVALISTDTWRPAAFDQLKQLGEQIEIDVYGDPSLKSPNEIYTKYSKELEAYDVVIIDSAGRDQLNDELVQEIINLNDLVNPTDTFMVLGADVGQSAQKQAQSFKENLGVTGVVITKMDGTGKGGGALSACSTIEVPVRFIGVGEKVDDLERFNSQKFVSTMLGMGDIDTLLEKAQLAIDDDKARQMGDKMMKGDFDLDDLSEQLGAMKKMGSMGKIMGMIPGMGGMNLPKDEMAKQEVKMKKWKHILSSMTQHERRNPDCLDISRVTRCAKGAGASIGNVRELLKHFKQTKKMMGMFKNPGAMEDMEDMDPKKMMKHMKGMKGMNKFMKK